MLGGCILSMVAFFVAANRRAQRLSENAEDLHGSARLASPERYRGDGHHAQPRAAFTLAAGTTTRPADCNICATTAQNMFWHLPQRDLAKASGL